MASAGNGNVRAHETTPSMFVTSILNGLAATSSSRDRTKLNNNEIPEAIRPLFSTLHLLFPHILLDALDLFDRGLVTRLKVHSGKDVEVENKLNEESQSHFASLEPVSRATTRLERGDLDLPPKKFYHVQSAQILPHYRKFDRFSIQSLQETSSNQSHHAAQTYQVHLDAWNCSCPAFAYAAFSNPTVTDSAITSASDMDHQMKASPQQKHGRDVTAERVQQVPQTLIQFGGLVEAWRTSCLEATNLVAFSKSTSSSSSEMPPVCKHLLASSLAEVCPEIFPNISASSGTGLGLGGVVEHSISPQEAAGWASG